MKKRLAAWFMDFQMTFGLGGPPLSKVTPEEWARKVRKGLPFKSVPKDKRTEEVCLAAVQSNAWEAMRLLLTREQRTPAVTLAALQIDGYLIGCLTPEERTPEICHAAVLQNSGVLAELTPEEITHDLILAAVSKSGSAILELNDTQRTPDVCLASVRLYHWNIQHLTPAQRTTEVCLAAVQQDGHSIKHLTDAQRTPEVCLAAVQQNCHAIEHLSEAQRTPELCLVALQTPPRDWRAGSPIRHLSLQECVHPMVSSWIIANWAACASSLGNARAVEVARGILTARQADGEGAQPVHERVRA